MTTFLAHYAIGIAGAGAGWLGSGWCKHLSHRLIVTGTVVAIESAISVAVVG